MHKASRVVAVLRRFRELAGLTQKEMAIRTGISESTIQKIESGKSEMKLGQLNSYMKVLGITLIDIEIATQKGDYVLEKDIAAASRLLSIKERRALLRFINDLRQ
ncbi:helix-turn-helix transcriptional regulator [Vibrio aestuarianus]|uniref:helix-turn-helix domain-containing protein n=1 Tax=Vibrio aestuarianus TaxID=28171 RepID=UPI0015932D4C|nr:helix-turn-helix transcriptional regulator [Vibrio aestuarianus]NGZ18002.1 helix-turn-helix transcriptional regulator [Vibrio aestuarianus]